MPITTKRYAKQDIINSALFNIGYGVIAVELVSYTTIPGALDALYDKCLLEVNNYVPELREQTITPYMGTGERNGYADIPDIYRDGRSNDPISVLGIEPNGMSWYERNQDFGMLTFNRFLYTYEPGVDALMLNNFKARKKVYGLNFAWKQDPSNPKRVYFDDLPYTGNEITVAFTNYWNPDAGLYNGTTTAVNFIVGEPAGYLIDLLTARLKKVTGTIRSKLSGGERSAVLDGQDLVAQGNTEETTVMERLVTGALCVGYRQQ